MAGRILVGPLTSYSAGDWDDGSSSLQAGTGDYTGWIEWTGNDGSAVLDNTLGGGDRWMSFDLHTDSSATFIAFVAVDASGNGPGCRFNKISGPNWEFNNFVRYTLYTTWNAYDSQTNGTLGSSSSTVRIGITVDESEKICRLWYAPTEHTPYDVNNWDSASDTAEHTTTACGITWDGTQMGIGADDSASQYVDNIRAGDFTTTSIPVMMNYYRQLRG